jgi:hypothetical protein
MTHQSANIKYCFTSTLAADQQPGPEMKRKVFLHVESSHLKEDQSKEQKSRFQAMEAEVRWLVQMLDEAEAELRIYDTEDTKMYQVNENTKARVFNYSGFSFLVLIGLTIWEVYYLHSFFKAKVIIIDCST